MASGLAITLPKWNGDVVVGIASSSDKALAEDKRLRVYYDAAGAVDIGAADIQGLFLHPDNNTPTQDSVVKLEVDNQNFSVNNVTIAAAAAHHIDLAIGAPWFTGSGNNDAKTLAVLAAWRARDRVPAGTPKDLVDMYSVAAYVAIAYGLVGFSDGKNGGEGSGDFTLANLTTYDTFPSQAQADTITVLLTEDSCSKVLTAMLATKLNYFQTNHHVGQEATSPYITKVIGAVFSSDPNLAMGYRTFFHTVGHWVNTHRMLRLLGIHTPVAFVPVMAPVGKLALADDITLRKDMLPSGIGRHALAYATNKRLGTAPIWAFCPRLPVVVNSAKVVKDLYARLEVFRTKLVADQLANPPFLKGKFSNSGKFQPQAGDIMRKVVDPRAEMHIGADYLMLYQHKRFTVDVEEAIGLIGPVLYHLFGHHSLTRSPAISKKVGKQTTANYQNAEGFDSAWESAVVSLAGAITSIKPDKIMKAYGATTTGLVIKDSYIEWLQGTGTDRVEATNIYDRLDAAVAEEAGPDQ